MDSPSGGSRSTGKISKIDEQSDANTENVLLPMAYARPGPASSAELPPVRNTFIFGILNITDDSFSDAGKFLDPKVAREHAGSLIAGGANALQVLGVAPEGGDSADAVETATLVAVARVLMNLDEFINRD